MIEYDAKGWIQILFKVHGSVMPKMAGRVLFCAGLGAGAAYLYNQNHNHFLEPIAHTMIGVALGLLLVFRTNASYDRYWEGRKLLGSMVNRCRDLVRQIAAFLPGAEHAAERQHLRNLVVAWYRLMAQTLRSEDDLSKLTSVLTDQEREALAGSKARSQVVLTWITSKLSKHAQQGRLTQQQLQLADGNITALMDNIGGCERIVRTPVPFAYAQHIKLFSTVFCMTAPFAMSKALGWYTPIAAALLCFALMGIDEIGVEIEDPFGYDANDLPVDGIGDGIDRVTQGTLDGVSAAA